MYQEEQGQPVPEQGELNEEAAEMAGAEAEDNNQEGEGSGDGRQEVQGEEEGQKKGRSIEEKIDFLKEEFELKDDDFVVGKDGSLKIVEKINGKKYLVTPKQYRKGFNINQAGYQRLNEAKQRQKEIEEFEEMLKSNPDKLWELADKHGVNKYDLAEKLLAEKLAEMEMSPAEKERLEWEKKYKEKEEENKKLKEQEEQRVFEAEKQKSIQKFDQELTKAMVDHGFTKQPREVKSNVLYTAIQKLIVAKQSNRDLSADQAVFLAKQEWQEGVLGYFDEIDDDHILKLVPDKIIQAIRKADLNRLKTGTPTANSRVDQLDQQVELEEFDAPRGKKKQSLNDYFYNL